MMKFKKILYLAVFMATVLFTNDALAQNTVLQSEDNTQINGSANVEDNVAQNIGNVADGDWVKYSQVDLTGVLSFSASVAKNQNGDRTIKMHLDDGAGAPGVEIGSVIYGNAKNGWQNYTETDIAILTQSVTGIQDVYFVITGGFINIDFFTLQTSIVDPSLPAVNDEFTEGDYSYTVTSIDPLEAQVSGSTLTALTIPATATHTDKSTEYAITAIGSGAFLGNETVTSVVLPTSVTVINQNAFSGCVNLETINLENIVTIETQNAFFNTPKLTTANLSALTDIGNFAFHGLATDGVQNSTLTSISIPNMVNIGDSSFRTSQITSIDIPASVLTIAQRAFMDCTALTEVKVNWTTAETIPVIVPEVFTNLAVENIKLIVPTGTESLYETVTGWQDLNIEGFVDTVVGVECVEEAESNRIATLDNGSWSQSFTPACSGDITGITFSSAQAVGGATLVVGTGNHCAEEGSTILTTKTISNIAIDDNLVAIDDVSVVAGTVYYFKVTTDGDETFQINFNNGNPYAGGFLTTHTDDSDKSLCDREFATFDWKFKVEISDNLSVGDIEENQILIYPNPVVSDFTITNSKGASVMIYDILGKLVIDTKVQTNEESVNVSGLNSGIYNVRISNNGTISSQKLIKR